MRGRERRDPPAPKRVRSLDQVSNKHAAVRARFENTDREGLRLHRAPLAIQLERRYRLAVPRNTAQRSIVVAVLRDENGRERLRHQRILPNQHHVVRCQRKDPGFSPRAFIIILR
jgi:hypothetical protein